MNAQEIIKAVARECNMSVRMMQDPSRETIFAWPRQVAMYEVRERTDLSYPEIARIFKRNHTTILHAHRHISEVVKGESKKAIAVRELQRKLNLRFGASGQNWPD
jgi:chromosomal replication initiator protein